MHLTGADPGPLGCHSHDDTVNVFFNGHLKHDWKNSGDCSDRFGVQGIRASHNIHDENACSTQGMAQPSDQPVWCIVPLGVAAA